MIMMMIIIIEVVLIVCKYCFILNLSCPNKGESLQKQFLNWKSDIFVTPSL
jgi:hypothetical protein